MLDGGTYGQCGLKLFIDQGLEDDYRMLLNLYEGEEGGDDWRDQIRITTKPLHGAFYMVPNPARMYYVGRDGSFSVQLTKFPAREALPYLRFGFYKEGTGYIYHPHNPLGYGAHPATHHTREEVPGASWLAADGSEVAVDYKRRRTIYRYGSDFWALNYSNDENEYISHRLKFYTYESQTLITEDQVRRNQGNLFPVWTS